MSERTEFEKDIISAILRVCNYHTAEAEIRQVRTARILVDCFEQRGLAAAAKLVCSMQEFGEKIRARS